MSHKLIHDVSVVLGEVESELFRQDQIKPFGQDPSEHLDNALYLIAGGARQEIMHEPIDKDAIISACASLVRMLADMKTVVVVGLLLLATAGRGQYYSPRLKSDTTIWRSVTQKDIDNGLFTGYIVTNRAPDNTSQSLDTAKARILYDYIASDSLPVTSQVYSVNGYVVRGKRTEPHEISFDSLTKRRIVKYKDYFTEKPLFYLTGAKTRIPEKNVWNYKMGW